MLINSSYSTNPTNTCAALTRPENPSRSRSISKLVRQADEVEAEEKWGVDVVVGERDIHVL